jgi:hypothetical protein
VNNNYNNTMKKSLLLIPFAIALAIFFYPTTSNSNGTGSPGAKTNSPMDGGNCTGCHSGTLNSGVGTTSITTNIPSSGYMPGNTYTITTNIQEVGIFKFGFEISAEEGNFGSAKTGSFMVTNSTETKFANNNEAITHKAAGTSGFNSRSWSMDWEAPSTGTGDVTFYASAMASNGNTNNNGDNVYTTSLTINEEVVNAISDNNLQTPFTYNSATKTIETLHAILVYDISGKLVLTTKEKSTTISHLKNGIYILKSENKTKKIILN